MIAKRIIMILMSFVLLSVTFESVRRRKLRERYAILWVAASMAVLASAIFPAIPDWIARTLGITFIEGAAYLFAFFLVMVLFHVSIAISNLRSLVDASARRLALLEAETAKQKREAEKRPASANKATDD